MSGETDVRTAIDHDEGRGAQDGFLVLADISGFTAFTTATELEHGAEITGALLAEVMSALSPPLEIQELEGDAVFAIGPDRVVTRGVPLLGLLRRAGLAFRVLQEKLQADDSCSCGACSNVHMLDLKIVVHHGSFMRHSVRGLPRVAGPDVILAHKLLKNEIDGEAYILLTRAALERLELDPTAEGAQPVTESYDHFGEVACFALELDSVAAV